MNPRYRETFRRRRGLFILPIVLGAVIALWASLGSPKLYRSGASIWSDTVGGSQAFGAPPPAAQDQAMLNELLKTNYFTHNVAHKSGLDVYLAHHSSDGWGPTALLRRLKGTPSIDDRIMTALGPKHVLSTVQGNHVLEITFDAQQPKLAQKTMAALIDEFKQQRGILEQDAIVSAQKQVEGATNALSKARSNLNSYLQSHPGSTTGSDPELRALTNAEHSAVRQLSAASDTLGQASGAVLNGSGIATSLKVLDAPRLPLGPSTGKKKVVESTLAGAFGGLVVSILAVVLMTKVGQSSGQPRPPRPAEEREPADEGPPTTNGDHTPADGEAARREQRRQAAQSDDFGFE